MNYMIYFGHVKENNIIKINFICLLVFYLDVIDIQH